MKKFFDCLFLSVAKAFLFICMTNIIMILDLKIRDTDTFLDLCRVIVLVTVSINILLVIVLYKRHQNTTHTFVMDLVGMLSGFVFTLLYFIIGNLVDFNMFSFFGVDVTEASSGAGLILFLYWIMYFVSVFVSKIVLYIIFCVMESRKNKSNRVALSHTPPFKTSHKTIDNSVISE